MISKERLEELIEQGATIYEVKYNNINPVSLKNKIRFISEKYSVVAFEPRPNEKYKHHKYFDKLFETLEDAEWHKEFGCIERTERLELPTWEEINKKMTENSCLTFYEDRKHLGIITPLKTIVINNYNEWPPKHLFLEPLTKENYTLACRKAKELFLGEKENV